MKNYPRALNRLLAFLVSLLLLALGTALLAAVFMPEVAKQWEAIGSNVEQWWTNVSKQSTVIGQDFSWMSIAAIAVGIIVILLLLAVTFSQGGGRTSNLEDPQADDLGKTLVTPSFIEDLIGQKAADNHWIHSISANTYKVKKDAVLALEVLTHKGASPVQISDLAEDLVSDLDEVMGSKTPIYVHLTTNWQTAISKRKRVQ